MGTTRKIAVGIGLASGALLAAWLLTGSRKKKTKDFLVKTTDEVKKAINKQRVTMEDSDRHFY
jgi:hypothetical protein